jgi:hypothetical protein
VCGTININSEPNIKSILNVIEKCDYLINNIDSTEQTTLINFLKDKNYNLTKENLIYIEHKLGVDIIYEMLGVHNKIYNFIENKILNKIIDIEVNQTLLITNQKIIIESMNQINGNNYDIQTNVYLNNLGIEKDLKFKIVKFYNNLVKKMNSYNFSAAVLSSGEISVNDSMVDTSAQLAKGSISLLETAGGSLPFGSTIASMAAAGGIYYLNEKQLDDNRNYYDMLNSVMHSEGISKLGSMKIIKQLNIDITNAKDLNPNNSDFFIKKWREAQMNLIKEKKLPIYSNTCTEIENFVINITKYHNCLCEIILPEFLNLIVFPDSLNKIFNCLCCNNYTNILCLKYDYNNSETNFIIFVLLKSYFNTWKTCI